MAPPEDPIAGVSARMGGAPGPAADGGGGSAVAAPGVARGGGSSGGGGAGLGAMPALPSISLPKGGGAIRGIGEKFAANPVTGTGSMSVPIATSPGRSGAEPQLALSYDSGAGNGPFGFGWSLSLPAITRKTDKGLPRYEDADDSDVFILSGAEDLVPEYRKAADGAFERDAEGQLVRHEHELDGYLVRRYRPRIEGLFARIERWTRGDDPADVHWRSISRDNVLTIYGLARGSRIADPLEPRRIFSWLICETRDDRGNGILYRYREEDGAGVNLGAAHQGNRGPADDDRRTANRYLKRVLYGNRTPLLDNAGRRPRFLDPTAIEDQVANAGWMFEVILDYGEHDADAPTPTDARTWAYRPDAFSSFRSGFEVRTARRCRRLLMFHHFPADPEVGRDCLVRSTDLAYASEDDPQAAQAPIYSFLAAVTQAGYRRDGAGYVRRTLPPVEFEYSQAAVQNRVEELDPESLDNLPAGLDGREYSWADLHGEGIPGILTEQGDAWFYKRNLSPMPTIQPDGTEAIAARLGPLETVGLRPSLSLDAGAALMDLGGDGQPDLVVMDGPVAGLFEHDDAEGWSPFRPFPARLNLDLRDPNVRLLDLDGDGLTDVLVADGEGFTWHPSLGEDGFAGPRRLPGALDDEAGPRLVVAGGDRSVHVADMSGDGLGDLVRIGNGEVSYYPSLGHGRFGARIAMDNAPWFDAPDQFDPLRLRLADIDGSGTTDLVYLHRHGIRLYFNQSGNGWSAPVELPVTLAVDDVASVMPIDLLGTGTSCLVWSSPLPGESGRQMRYIDLMGGKPHLLTRTANNLGAETRIGYAPSTRFYLEDRAAGRPWIRRLPFPVHVVVRVETVDYIGRNRFVTRFAYHHGHFDGEEREFRGFGRVDQWDTERMAALTATGDPLTDENISESSHVPPVHTVTWFHTGVLTGRGEISHQYEDEYFREPGLTPAAVHAMLLDDTVLPPDLDLDELREACRALKGSMLREEVYADDASRDATPEQCRRAETPYTVTEQNFGVRTLQPRADNRHAVFVVHPRETLSYQYERNPFDPRTQHELTLDVDAFGNVLKQATVGYGRRATVKVDDGGGGFVDAPSPGLAALSTADADRQRTALVIATANRVTTLVDDARSYRVPRLCEAITYQLTGYPQTGTGRYTHADLVEPDPADDTLLRLVHDVSVPYDAQPPARRCIRPAEHARMLFRSDDLETELPLGEVEPLALPGRSFRLALTSGLLSGVFVRRLPGAPDESLIPDPDATLQEAGYVSGDTMKATGRFPDSDDDGQWWLPSGRVSYSDDPGDDAAEELAAAREHYFLPRRHADPYGNEGSVDYDADDLLVAQTRDALGNATSVLGHDHRALQPRIVSNANHNRTELAFDILGSMIAVARMGKPAPAVADGDAIDGIVADPEQTLLDGLFDGADARVAATALLGKATTRFVYDLDRFRRSRAAHPELPASWSAPASGSVKRTAHVSLVADPTSPALELEFWYSDGLGREIQRKQLAEPGPVEDGGADVDPRFIASGWTVFNNKGQPVRQYEPFYSAHQAYEFGTAVGVSPVIFYDPPERAVATVLTNDAYEKVVFSAWDQASYDANDTCAPRGRETGDPRTDPHIRDIVNGYFRGLQSDPAHPWKTWLEQRIGGGLGSEAQEAAQRASAHSDTPTHRHVDTLGRPFLTVRTNRVQCPDHDLDGTESSVGTRVVLDVAGNELEVLDSLVTPGDGAGRVLARSSYDLLGNRIHTVGIDSGARWSLFDASGGLVRTWDDRGHTIQTTYDALRRPLERSVSGVGGECDPRTKGRTVVFDRIEYGEPPPGAPQAEQDRALSLNLRTQIYRHFDPAGVIVNAKLDAAGDPVEAFDFKGNQRWTTRTFAKGSAEIVDWSGAVQLHAESIEARTTFDALDRPIQSVAPHRRTQAHGRSVVQRSYNANGLLDRVDVWLDRAAIPSGRIDPATDPPSAVGVAETRYDARGRRIEVRLRNGATTSFAYERDTGRLLRQYTIRSAAFVEDATNPAPPPATIAAPAIPPQGLFAGLQNLHYTYDPVGNVTHVRDDAQPTVYFRNQRVDPDGDYVYDALYQLAQARGREHLGQVNGVRNAPGPTNASDAVDLGIDHPGDGGAMGRYVEQYVYDGVGNLRWMRHRGSDPANPGWSRGYQYVEPSAIPGVMAVGNRLSSTSIGAAVETYTYDRHGNAISMPHLSGQAGPNIEWDFLDQLRGVDLGGGGTAAYRYDAAGQRVRKIWQKAPGRTDERIYLLGSELYRRHGGPVGDLTATLERETLDLRSTVERIALVETRTLDVDGIDTAPLRTIRYQLSDHVGSCTLELDDGAQIVSYEEYAPFGATTYQAVRALTEVSKRYRFASRERDEESGFCYFGARYYPPWLGRWLSCDPAGTHDDINSYAYVRNSPVTRTEIDGRESKRITIESEVVILDDAGKIKIAKKSHTETLVSGNGKTKVLRSTERNMTKKESERSQVRMDELRKEAAQEKAREEAAEKEAQKPPEKFKLVVGINVSSVDKKGTVQVYGGRDGNPGHTFVAIKGSDGKIVRILSYGPVKQSGLGQLSCSAPGDAKYHLLAADEFQTYEFDITKEQSDKAIAKIDEIDKAPGTYSGTHQCTSTALEVVDAAGIKSVPRGKGNIRVPLCGDVIGVPTPYHLDKELKGAGYSGTVTKGTDYRDQGVPVH